MALNSREQRFGSSGSATKKLLQRHFLVPSPYRRDCPTDSFDYDYSYFYERAVQNPGPRVAFEEATRSTSYLQPLRASLQIEEQVDEAHIL